MTADIFADPRVLSELADRVSRAGLRSDGLSAQIDGELARCRRRIEDTIREAMRDVRRCEAALLAAEKEDRRAAEADLRAAIEHLRDLKRAASPAREALDDAARSRQAAQARIAGLVAKAAAFLATVEADLQAYLAVAAPGGAVASSPSGSSSAGSAGGASVPSLAALLAVSLPDGWEWMPLDQFSRSADLGPAEGFPKVTHREMVEGFARLQRDVLPALGGDWQEVSDRLRALDAGRGIHDTSGLHGAFEAFFSNTDYIRPERPRGADGYGVTNGRHRIAVARELGWPAVPVRFETVRPGR